MAREIIKNLHLLIEEETKKTSLEELFLQELIYNIENNTISRPMSRYYKPSSLNCLRSMYYQRTGVELVKQRRQYNRIGEGESGTDRHSRIQEAIVNLCKNKPEKYEWVDIQEYINNNNIEFLEVKKVDGYETKLFHSVLELSFQCDGILRININGNWEYFILEIKTENSLAFSKRAGINEYHKSQVTAYSTALCIDNILFLYESRNTLEKKTYVTKITTQMKQDLVVNKINECENYLSQNLLPPRNESNGCVYCNYLSMCKEAGN